MRILVTNDDGINAPGLESCARIAASLSDDVWVLAPEFDQSGVAHSLSLNDPLRLRRLDEKRYAVRGTPTDCVIMAVRHVMKEKRPDLVHEAVLDDEAPVEWRGQVEQAFFRGRPYENEVAFFHRASRTLVVCDLAFNFGPRNALPTPSHARIRGSSWRRVAPPA